MTNPSTTESATNRIDPDSLSAALTAAGWAWEDSGNGVMFTLEDPDTIHWRERRYIDFHREHISLGWQSRDYHEGAHWHPFAAPVDVTEPAWQHALDLIRAHTTPARSHDDACPTAGGKT